MSKIEQVSKAAREQGLKAAQAVADQLNVGLYQSAHWPKCGQVWQIRNGQWIKKLGDVTFCDQPDEAPRLRRPA